MRCEDIRDLFSELYDGVADEEDEIAAHLQECNECAKDYMNYCNLLIELRELPTPELPEGFHDLAMARVREVMPRPKKRVKEYWHWAGVGAAACLIGISLLVSGVSELTSVPPGAMPAPVPQAAYTNDLTMPIAAGAGGTIDVYPEVQQDGLLGDNVWGYEQPAPVGIAPSPRVGDTSERDIVMPASSQPAPLQFAGMTTEALPGHQQYEFFITIVVDDLDYAILSVRELSGHTLWSEVLHWDNGGQAIFHRRVDFFAYAETQHILRNIGSVSHEREFITHVTNEVTDLEAQLIANREELSRLTALLVASDNMEVLIAVEGRLGQVEANRDFLQGRMNQLLGMSAQPLISIELRQQAHDIRPEPESFGERVQHAFLNSIDGLVAFAGNTVVFLSAIFLPLLVIGVVFGPVWWFVIRRRRKKDGG